jgi:hypothetical protein
MRRALLPVAITAALAAGIVPASAVTRPKAPPIPACPAFADPAKDDAAADVGSGEDPALDIVGAKISVANKTLKVVLSMGKVGQPSFAEGQQYAGGFTLGGSTVELFGTSSLTAPVMGAAFAMTGINVDGSYVQGTNDLVTITTDTAKNTVTLSTALANVASAVGKKATGTVGGLQANVSGTYVALIEPWDTAETTKKLRLDGCR